MKVHCLVDFHEFAAIWDLILSSKTPYKMVENHGFSHPVLIQHIGSHVVELVIIPSGVVEEFLHPMKVSGERN